MLSEDEVGQRLLQAGQAWRTRFDAQLLPGTDAQPPDVTVPQAPQARWVRTRMVVGVAVTGVVVAVLAVAFTMLGKTKARPVASPAPAATPTVPVVSSPPSGDSSTPTPPAGVADLIQVGINGTTAWRLSHDGVDVTTDFGKHWTHVVLPAGVTARQVVTVAVDTTSSLWLTVASAQGSRLYRWTSTSGTWTHQSLDLSTSGIDLSGGGAADTIALGPGQLVTVVVARDFSMFSAYNRIFVSGDGGTTFTRHPAPDSARLHSVAYTDPQHGIAVTGPTGLHRNVYTTSDGGEHWQTTALPVSVPNGSQLQVSIISATSTALTLSAIVNDLEGNQDLTLLTSTDGGRTFAPQGRVLRIPAARSAGDVAPASTGEIVWLRDRTQIIRSTDAGMTWTTTTNSTAVDSVAILTATTALAVASDNGCTGFKTGCYNYRYLVTTNDGGHTWQPIPD